MIEISHLLAFPDLDVPTRLGRSPVVLSPGEGHPQHRGGLAGGHHAGVLGGAMRIGPK